MPLYAKGGNIRDWLYVGDCIRGVDFILEHGEVGEIYNLGGGSEVSNLELTRAILKEFGKSEEFIQYVPDRPAHDFRYSLNTSKLTRRGFQPASDFYAHLKSTVRWYQTHRSWWEPLKIDVYTVK